MEHFMRIAFWIFTLSVTLSDCHPISGCNFIPDFNIEFMKKLTCVSNFLPNILNIFKCHQSALECIYIELNGTAQHECDDPERRIEEGLEALKRKMPNNTPSACACEKWPQKSFTEFLERYKSLLEKENAKSCR
uniref:Interleukin n=1 Tax=Poecilia reticulata TaxID=8081 RepID=A0A3P9NJH7_POERE